MSKKRTREQMLAITSNGKNIIVSAGAGSGKTSVLTERVVHFIEEEGYSIDDFLIVTFTNAAAAEMKKRIRKELQKANPAEAAKVDSAYICTFDSFFLSLVKQYHFELGISPDLEIMGEYLGAMNKRETLQSILEQRAREGSEQLSQLIDDYPNITPKTLIDYSLSLYDSLLKTGNYEEASRHLEEILGAPSYESAVTNDVLAKLLAGKERVDDAISDILAASAKRKPTASLSKMKELQERKCLSYDDIVAYEDELLNKPASGKDEVLAAASNDYAEAKAVLKKMLSALPKSESELASEVAADKRTTIFFLGVLNELHVRVSAWRKEHGLYDFDDIARMALDLVANRGKADEVGKRFKMVMVDEFQDTSLIQNKFIDLIGNGHLYLVGDVKQSIYLFRAARPDLFTARYSLYKDGRSGMAIDMNKNFRSRKEVLYAVNSIFGSIMDSALGGVDYRKDHVIQAGNSSFEEPGSKVPGGSSTEAICFDAYGLGEKTAEAEARIVARDIKKKMDPSNPYLVLDREKDDGSLRPVRFSDFAIIPDRSTDFEKILRVFSEEQVPLRLRFDEDIVENDLVRIVENLVSLYACIRDGDLSSFRFQRCFASIARSFLVRMDDQELYDICQKRKFCDSEIVSNLKSVLLKAKELPDTLLLREILDTFHVNDKILSIGNIDRNEAYLDAIEEMFVSSIASGRALDEIPSMLSSIRDAGEKVKIEGSDPGIDSVLLINIHKSKGLEFPITYFTGLYRMFNQEDFHASKEHSDPDTGFHFGKADPRCNVFSFLGSDRKLVSVRSESVRLLYVALTRTREKAYLLNPCKGLSTAPFRLQTIVASMIGENLKEGDVELLRNVLSGLETKIDPIFFDRLRDLSASKKKAKSDIKKCVASYLPHLTSDEEFSRCFGRYLRANKPSLGLLFSFFFRGDDRDEKAALAELPLLAASRESPSEIKGKALELAYEAIGLPLARSFGGDLPLALSDEDVDWERVIRLFESGKMPLDLFKAIDSILDSDDSPKAKTKALNYLGIPATEPKVAENGFSYRGELAAHVGRPTENRDRCKSFQEMLQPLLRRGYLAKTIVEKPSEIAFSQKETPSNKGYELEIMPANPYSFERKMPGSFSAALNFDVDPDALRYGTYLHEVMEGFNFKKPSFEGLGAKTKREIASFLSSPVAEDMGKAEIYPEYAFVDEDGKEGSIDLILDFGDHLRVIDYKSSDIDDPDYAKQVRGYMGVASRIFGCPSEGFLYSLNNGAWRKV